MDLNIYYQISGTLLRSDNGYGNSNMIIKITSDVPYSDGNGNLLVDSDYKAFKSKLDKDAGYIPYKINKNGERIVNILGYSLAPWDNDFSTKNYTAVQMQMISDTFGVPLANISVHQDLEEVE